MSEHLPLMNKMDCAPIKEPNMLEVPDVFALYDNTPDTLYDICMEYIVLNLNTITTKESLIRWRKLKDDVILPKEICERFLASFQNGNIVNDNVANLFRDRRRTRLEILKLRNARITDESLKVFLEHKPSVVELVQCEYLSQASLDTINANSKNLKSLKIGPTTYLLSEDDTVYRQRGYVIDTPKLQSLTIHRLRLSIFPIILLRPLTQLTHLDLTDCLSSTGSTWALNEITNLRSLVLHSVKWSRECFEWILCLQHLRHLDISQANERHGKFMNPNNVLAKIVTSLPHLESLDISGTNLAGTGAATVTKLNDDNTIETMELQVRCDIPGLVSRVDNPLEFLGLYGTHHGACKRHDVPAKIVSILLSIHTLSYHIHTLPIAILTLYYPDLHTFHFSRCYNVTVFNSTALFTLQYIHNSSCWVVETNNLLFNVFECLSFNKLNRN